MGGTGPTFLTGSQFWNSKSKRGPTGLKNSSSIFEHDEIAEKFEFPVISRDVFSNREKFSKNIRNCTSKGMVKLVRKRNERIGEVIKNSKAKASKIVESFPEN